MTGLYVVGLALVLALGFGLYRKAVDGRVRAVRTGVAASPLELDGEFGDTATFVQFSSSACAPCRATARVLDEVRTSTDGVTHIELDAEQRLDLVAELGITRTPTVLVLDGRGIVRSRMVGAPRREDVLAALAGLAGLADHGPPTNAGLRGRLSRATPQTLRTPA